MLLHEAGLTFKTQQTAEFEVIVKVQVIHQVIHSFHMFKKGSPSASADFQRALHLHYNVSYLL